MTRTERSFCRICLAHCGIKVAVDGDRPLKVVGDIDHPISGGYTCRKGRSLADIHDDPRRLNAPAVGRGSERRAVSWKGVLADLASRIAEVVDQQGPDALAVYTGSGAPDSAAAIMARRLVRAIGTRSIYSSATIDAPSKSVVGALLAGHPGIFGAGVGPKASLTILIGTNPAVSHGHTSALINPRARLRTLSRRGELWVVDPRETESTRLATRHLRPRPGTDFAWLAAMVREMLTTVDHAELSRRAYGADELARAVEPFTLQRAASITGLARSELEDLRAALIQHGRFAGVSGTGVTMGANAVVTQWLLTALLAITDSADDLCGTVFNPGFIHAIDKHAWRSGIHQPGPGPRSRPELPRQFGELPSAALVDEIEAGHVRALLVMGGNLLTALPGPDRTRAALDRLDVLAVADVVETETVDRATHILACAGQLERADITYGTDQFLESVSAQYTDAVVPPAQQRRELWRILADLGDLLGKDLLDGRVQQEVRTSQLFAEAMRDSRGDFESLAERRILEVDGPVVGWVRESVAARGGWQLAPRRLVEQLTPRTAARNEAGAELLLVPLRQLGHMNSQHLTAPHPDSPEAVFVHGSQAARLGLSDHQQVVVRSQHGQLRAVLRVDERVPTGVVGVPHGYAGSNVNRLTDSESLEPLTGMPEYAALRVSLHDASNASSG